MSGETRNVSARDWLKANKPRLRWYPWEGLRNRKYQAVDPSFKHPDWVVAAVYTMGTEGFWHIEDVRDVSLHHFYHFVSDDAAGAMAKAEDLWFNRANLAEAEEGSARAFLKSVGRPLRWEDTGRISRGYDDTWTKDPGATVAKVSMKDYGVWTLSYVRGWIVSMQRYPSKKDAQQRAERLWFQVRHTPGVVEAKEGSARDFFRANAPKLTWKEERRQGRRWRYGSDTSLTKVCRYWIASEPVAMIVETKDGWRIVRVEKVSTDYSPIYKTAEAAQEYAERLWFGIGREAWIAPHRQTEAAEGSARDFLKSVGQLTLQPANDGRDVIADSPWGRAYMFRRGDTVSLMGHDVSDVKRFLPRLLAELKKAGFTEMTFRLTDQTDSWYVLIRQMGIRFGTSALGWGTVAFVNVEL